MDPNIINILGVISFALGVVALIISLIQTIQSKKQTNKLESHSNTLGVISESLSTRYIGPFPEYLTSVINLIEKANSEIRIVIGNPTPAMFTAPMLWVNYSQTIERKAHSDVVVDLVSMGLDQRKMRLAQQFPTSDEEWKSWMPANQEKLEHFLKFGFSEIKPDDLDHQKFLDILLKTQTNLLNAAFRLKGVDVVEIDQVIPVQVWIVDKKEAIFSIQTLPTKAASYGFITSDPRIVSALIEMTDLFKNQRTPIMNIHSRIDKIIVTKDLNKSINLYRDQIGLEMRLLSNPVAIFKYEYISIYVYLEDFFKEQFGIDSSELVGNGMLSIQMASENDFENLKNKLADESKEWQLVNQTKRRLVVRDFNDLVLEFWLHQETK